MHLCKEYQKWKSWKIDWSHSPIHSIFSTVYIPSGGNTGRSWDQSPSLGLVSLTSQTLKLKKIYMIKIN